jgi:hypothetical protein
VSASPDDFPVDVHSVASGAEAMRRLGQQLHFSGRNAAALVLLEECWTWESGSRLETLVLLGTYSNVGAIAVCRRHWQCACGQTRRLLCRRSESVRCTEHARRATGDR